MPMGTQSPHFCLRLASLGAVPFFRGRTGAGKGPAAAFRLANPEPAGAGLGDQAGQPGNGPGRVPVSGRTALYQVNVPLLVAIVAGELGVNGMPGEQRVEPCGDLPGLAAIRRGEDQQQFLAE